MLVLCSDVNSEAKCFRVASELFSKRSRSLDNKALLTLGIYTEHGRSVVPTIGGILLFGIELLAPRFEELGSAFRVTLYAGKLEDIKLAKWETDLIGHLQLKKEIFTKEAAQFWGVSDRAARTRLLAMVEKELIIEIRTSPTDPKKADVLNSRSSSV